MYNMLNSLVIKKSKAISPKIDIKEEKNTKYANHVSLMNTN